MKANRTGLVYVALFSVSFSDGSENEIAMVSIFQLGPDDRVVRCVRFDDDDVDATSWSQISCGITLATGLIDMGYLSAKFVARGVCARLARNESWRASARALGRAVTLHQ